MKSAKLFDFLWLETGHLFDNRRTLLFLTLKINILAKSCGVVGYVTPTACAISSHRHA